MDIQYYSHLYGDWVSIDVNHSLKLSDIEDPVLFIKAAIVDCYLNFEHPLQQFLSHFNIPANHDTHAPHSSLSQHPLSADPYDSNLFCNPAPPFDVQQSLLPSDNGHVDDQDNTLTQRVKEKQHALSPSVLATDSSGSNTESSAIMVPSKRSLSASPDARLLSLAHSNPSSSHSDSSSIINQNKRCWHLSLPDSSCLLVTSFESTDSIVDEVSTGNLLMCGHSKNNPIEVENICHWPVDFHVSEIAEGFEQCSEAATTHKGVGKVFQCIFGVKFTSSTFYDNCRIWEHPPNLALRQQLIARGHHKDATWVAFMAKAECPPRA